jgi:replicative DNA helicase
LTTAKEHGRIVLGGIIPNRVDLLENALRELTPEHFVDAVQSNTFKLLEHYFQKTNGVLTAGALDDLLKNADAGRKALYAEAYGDYKTLKVDDSDYLWSVSELREAFAEEKMKSAIVDTMEILTKGLEQKGETLQGQEQAREYLLDKLSEIDSSMSEQSAPHGDMRSEAELILSEYNSAKESHNSGQMTGVQFGIPALDEKVGGLQRGDLVLSAAYSNDGKTTLCIQLAWSAAIEQGKNVLFLSTETVNTVVRRRLVARHSKHPKFAEWNLPEGLNSKNLKAGTLNAHEEEFHRAVVEDFTDPSTEYGHMYIHQVPRFATMDQVEQIMLATQKKFDIDLVVCDYLALLRPIGSRNTDRESLSGIIKNAKQIATTFNKGRGVPFVSPWQVNRAAKEDADSMGRYTSKALAETAEATNTPDIIVSILAPVDNTERYATLTAQVLKHRDGETADGISLGVDYATCAFTSRDSTIEGYAVQSFGSSFGALDNLI